MSDVEDVSLTPCGSACGLQQSSSFAQSCALQKARREEQFDALSDIANVLAGRLGHQQTLMGILEILETRLRLRRATIMLRTVDGTALEVAAARFSDPKVIDAVRYEPGEGIVGSVLQTGRPLVVQRIADEPRFRGRIHSRNDAEAAESGFVCVPILLADLVAGTLAADLPAEQRSQSDELLRTLTIVARMIGYDVRARRIEREEQAALQAENLRLRDALEERFRPENIVGNSRSMRDVYVRVRQVAASDTSVLILGESGTGKELVASAIHYSSPRAHKPFVRVHCAALSETLLESELFGHEKGAFTGAVKRRVGRIEEAAGGTLFLDEIGEFSPSLQVKLLRVLQEREFQRVGSNDTVKIDVRIVAATNRDLEKAIAEGAFRRDFYYRVNVFPIFLPALRERRDDVLLLAEHFTVKHGKAMNKKIKRISTPAINALLAYHWPGNVRELENCIEHAVVLSSDGVIHSHCLPATLRMPLQGKTTATGSFEAQVQALERDLISDALKRNGGSSASAARELGITPRILRYKVRKLAIVEPSAH